MFTILVTKLEMSHVLQSNKNKIIEVTVIAYQSLYPKVFEDDVVAVEGLHVGSFNTSLWLTTSKRS